MEIGDDITQALLQELFDYDGEHLIWKYHPHKRTSIKVKGTQFGCIQTNGYIRGVIFGKRCYEHRLIYLYYHGNWPVNQIDHIDLVKDNNQIDNLRDATNQQNAFNRRSRKNSSSKYVGVTYENAERQKNKWRAFGCKDGIQYKFGSFATEEAAAQARDNGVIKLYGGRAHLNFPD